MLTLIDLSLPKDIVDSTTLSQKIHSEHFIHVEHVLPPLITFLQEAADLLKCSLKQFMSLLQFFKTSLTQPSFCGFIKLDKS